MATQAEKKAAAEAAAKAAEAVTPETSPVMDSISEVLETAPAVETTLQNAPKEINIPQTAVPFTADQMDIIQQVVKQSQARGVNAPISVYGQRDPRVIQNVKVSNFNGKFVIGFKDLNNNPFRNTPKYSELKMDMNRKLPQEPHVTLLLSSNGTDIEELSVPLVDYMNNREKIEVPVIHMEQKEVIHEHGTLGRRSDEMAIAIDEHNKPLGQVSIKQESKEVIMKFYVQLPGFAHPVEFVGSDFLA